MRNKEVANVLSEVADLLDINGEEFKPNAFRRAARALEGLAEDVVALKIGGKLPEVHGIGEAIAQKIGEYLDTGSIRLLEELKLEIPAGVIEMLSIQGVGPKTASRAWKELGLTSIEELRQAAESHELRKLKGFGEKRESNILRAIRFLSESKKRTPLGVALPIGEMIAEHLRINAPVIKVNVAGSLRRMRESVGDLDFLVVSNKPEDVVRVFTAMPSVKEVLAAGDIKASVLLKEGVQADLRVLDEVCWGSGLQYFTGSKDHNVHLRTIAIKQGLKLNEYGVFRGEQRIAGETEEGLYAALGMEFIEPEMREDAGEIEAAQARNLPRLLTLKDIAGDFHIHTNMSDGADTLETIVETARAKGYSYIGISDHSKSLKVARGLEEERLVSLRDRIRELNRDLSDFKILLGTECEILDDGRLDYSDDMLRGLDYVIASVHTRFKMSSEEMTERIFRAISHPSVNILAHPFTGLIHRREPVLLNFERIAEHASANGTALEINSFPERLDINGAQARLAKERGAKIVINTDAHEAAHLDFMKFGVGTGRRGWLETSDVVNCWPYEQVRDFFSR